MGYGFESEPINQWLSFDTRRAVVGQPKPNPAKNR